MAKTVYTFEDCSFTPLEMSTKARSWNAAKNNSDEASKCTDYAKAYFTEAFKRGALQSGDRAGGHKIILKSFTSKKISATKVKAYFEKYGLDISEVTEETTMEYPQLF